jgi:hypothetical protein
MGDVSDFSFIDANVGASHTFSPSTFFHSTGILSIFPSMLEEECGSSYTTDTNKYEHYRRWRECYFSSRDTFCSRVDIPYYDCKWTINDYFGMEGGEFKTTNAKADYTAFDIFSNQPADETLSTGADNTMPSLTPPVIETEETTTLATKTTSLPPKTPKGSRKLSSTEDNAGYEWSADDVTTDVTPVKVAPVKTSSSTPTSQKEQQPTCEEKYVKDACSDPKEKNCKVTYNEFAKKYCSGSRKLSSTEMETILSSGSYLLGENGEVNTIDADAPHFKTLGGEKLRGSSGETKSGWFW